MNPIVNNLKSLYGISPVEPTIQKSEEPQIQKGGKRAEIGEMRIYGGQKWVKHMDGWVHVSENGQKALLEKPGGKREAAQTHHIEHYQKHSVNSSNDSEVKKPDENSDVEEKESPIQKEKQAF